jgi:hypothetical protein
MAEYCWWKVLVWRSGTNSFLKNMSGSNFGLRTAKYVPFFPSTHNNITQQHNNTPHTHHKHRPHNHNHHNATHNNTPPHTPHTHYTHTSHTHITHTPTHAHASPLTHHLLQIYVVDAPGQPHESAALALNHSIFPLCVTRDLKPTGTNSMSFLFYFSSLSLFISSFVVSTNMYYRVGWCG